MNPNVILCLIEFSASGASALVQAVELARWYGADLHVAHVQGGRAPRQAASEPSNTDGVDRRLSSFMEAVDTQGLRLSTVALAGDPVTAVVEHARLIAADLAVVARHGRRYGLHWRPGVFAKDLARVLPCPTLVVPDAGPRDAKGSFVNILCPTDFSVASAAALQKAVILAKQSGGRLTLLHVLEGFPYGTVYSGGEAFRLIGEYRARVDAISRRMRSAVPPDAFNWCQVDTRAVSGVAHRTIVSTASELDADLIVMGLPERSGIDRVIMASTATPVLQSAVCPVLMVRASAGDVSRVTFAAAEPYLQLDLTREFEELRHDVEALEDSACLLTIAGPGGEGKPDMRTCGDGRQHVLRRETTDCLVRPSRPESVERSDANSDRTDTGSRL